VYSLRTLEASTVYLPAPGAGGAFESVLEPRRTRVVPDRLLSLTRLYSLTAHEDLLVFDLLGL
jgi:hypothetical protein